LEAIQNDNELASVVAQVNDGLQAIQNYVGERKGNNNAKVRFPSGFIRTAESQRQRLRFVTDATLRDNLSYMLMLSDVYLWLLKRTSLLGTAQEMVVKAAIFLAGAIIESLTKDYLTNSISKNAGFKQRTQRLLDDGRIDDSLKMNLDWVWDTRNNMHAFLVTQREWNKYDQAQYSRAATAVSTLIENLNSAQLETLLPPPPKTS
jgi:hypothetical protein